MLKGRVGSTIELDGEADPGELVETTFANHTEERFWKHAGGRTGIETDCSLLPPSFAVRKRYLIILGLGEDTKQFEQVDREDERWLRFVESELVRAY